MPYFLPKFKFGVIHFGVIALIVFGLLAVTVVISQATTNYGVPRNFTIFPNSSKNQSQPLTSASSATCEVLSPPATSVSGLESIGITKVYRVKPGDDNAITIKVTGVPRSDRLYGIMDRQFPYYALKADSFTLRASGQRSGLATASAEGTFTQSFSVSKDLADVVKRPGFYASFPDKARGLPLYYLYLFQNTGGPRFLNDCGGGYLLVEKT
ncbi:hypothetical protein A3A60_04850 [Candidatus Curtissbacteria bacterium RIFCSPLOWO2_01_FULL_42_26]|uniref:Uncharacterized protein n=1 Tax=Candidatus Curtissbacteria bacterium RIFCSPLOWO2_01_FULL_42_26 TaxID=1797729 RepID=A0A1F5I0G2_9BACT|nr:MAG: hypothetical protein A3A60_04850 [Candidatus Curtissbacteria bacterium RIFCSPLOWO2_01_FULL_42_26]